LSSLSSTFVICGVPPVRSIGAGRLAMELERQAAGPKSVILLHPQSIGGRWCLDLIRRRRQPTWIYLLDSSFFCIRSYNHLATEHDACVRCLGGAWSAAQAHDCRPYPAGHDCGLSFLEELRTLAANGRVRFMAQNPGQATLAERHFGPLWPVPVVGMWTIDLAEVFDETLRPRPGRPAAEPYDVVFHGGDHPAKGFGWALDVARRLPASRFLFPMAWRSGAGWGERPANCDFVPMTWESGLEDDAVGAATVTLVPSLWSAPVEGALVKSIVVGRAVAAPDVVSGFVADLPAGVVRLLDRSPAAAAEQLRESIAAGWRPEAAAFAAWKSRFEADNSALLATMLRAVSQTMQPSP